MMVERVRPRLQSKLVTKELLNLFGQSPLLEGEDAAAYDQLVARLFAAVKPVDVIDEMFVADVVSLEWEILRLRRLKLNLIRTLLLAALQAFLDKHFWYDTESKHFLDYLAEILRENLPEGEAKSARTLAYRYTRDDDDAVKKVNSVLGEAELDMDQIESDARAEKIKQLMQEYVWQKPEAARQVQELLAEAGRSMYALLGVHLVQQQSHYLEYIERIDRLITIAESRRNASLREIERRRSVLGQALQRSVQEVEDTEFKVIETTPTKGKNAA